MLQRAVTRRAVPPGARPQTNGYTLLELLIVIALLGVLMLGVWSLLKNWGGLYERGERRTRKSQLARSVCAQLTDDLHDVTYRPPARRRRRPSETPAPSGIGLVGEADWLVLDVLQPVNPYQAAHAAAEGAADQPDQAPIGVPEVQRVIYRFYGRTDSREQPLPGDETMAYLGLVRVGIAREYYSQLTTLQTAGGALDRDGSSMLGEVDRICETLVSPADGESPLSDPLTDPTEDRPTADMGRPQLLPGVIQQDEMAEVGYLEFRYFNGSQWLDRWDSRTQGRLPVAVEVRFELIDPPAEDESGLTEEQQAEADLLKAAEPDNQRDTALLEGDQPDWAGRDEALDLTGASADEPAPFYRCVVYLEPPKEWPAASPEDESSGTAESAPNAPSEQAPDIPVPR